jgi:hypothetical protein
MELITTRDKGMIAILLGVLSLLIDYGVLKLFSFSVSSKYSSCYKALIVLHIWKNNYADEQVCMFLDVKLFLLLAFMHEVEITFEIQFTLSHDFKHSLSITYY